MNKHHLEDQALRAERLARSILDTVTVERLMAFAAECREKLRALEPERAQLLALSELGST